MITQHVVSFGDEITLTRLPAGRAEGFVWLSFVAAGAGETRPERAGASTTTSSSPGSTDRLLTSASRGGSAKTVAAFDVERSSDAGYDTVTMIHSRTAPDRSAWRTSHCQMAPASEIAGRNEGYGR